MYAPGRVTASGKLLANWDMVRFYTLGSKEETV